MCNVKLKQPELQCEATRIIPSHSLDGLPYNDRLGNMYLPSLQYQQHRGDLIFLYQISSYLIRISSVFIFAFIHKRPQQENLQTHSKCIPRTSGTHYLNQLLMLNKNSYCWTDIFLIYNMILCSFILS